MKIIKKFEFNLQKTTTPALPITTAQTIVMDKKVVQITPEVIKKEKNLPVNIKEVIQVQILPDLLVVR